MGNARLSGHPDHDSCGVGFVAQLGSLGSPDVIERALTALVRLTHRGGVDADGSSGDGAGLLLPIPKEFFRARAKEELLNLPVEFGVGMAFLPPGQENEARASVEKLSTLCGVQCCGWRKVPVDSSILGPSAAATLPSIQQCFFSPPKLAKLSNAGFSCFANASNPKAPTASISVRSPRAPWFTKACSLPGKSLSSILISLILNSRLPSPFFTSAIPPTPAPPGLWRSRSASSRTTVRSTPSARIAAGCARAKNQYSGKWTRRHGAAFSKPASAIPPVSTMPSTSICAAINASPAPCLASSRLPGTPIPTSAQASSSSCKRKLASRNPGTGPPRWYS